MSNRNVLTLPLFFLLLTTWSHAQRGAMTAPRTLQEMVSQSQTIVRGRVLLARVEPHPQYPNLTTVVVILRVEETLKGPAGGSLTIRQYVWDPRDREDAIGYRRGQRVLLLLNAKTSAGLTTPVGLQQGRFNIIIDKSGNEVAINGRDNADLFADAQTVLPTSGARMSPRARALVAEHRRGPVALESLQDAIRALAGSPGRPQ